MKVFTGQHHTDNPGPVFASHVPEARFRPDRLGAFFTGLRGHYHGPADVLAIVFGLLVIILARWVVRPGAVVWIIFGLFMSGVCGALGIVHRVQLVYCNQVMCWRGAPDEPFPVRTDEVTRWARDLRALFNSQASVMVVWLWWRQWGWV